MSHREDSSAEAALCRMLSERKSARVLAAMSPQQPDALIRLLLNAAVAMDVPVTLMFADLDGRLAFLDDALRPHIERGHIKLVALAGAVPRRWGSWIDYFPDSLWNIDRLIGTRIIDVDIVLARVWRREAGGGHDYGAMIGYTHTALTTGATAAFEVADAAIAGLRSSVTIPEGRATFVCEQPLLAAPDEAVPRAPSKEECDAGRHAVALLPPGVTVQVGIGGVGNAVAAELAHMPGLGLHSGIIPSALRGAICAGVINGAAKAVDPGLAVATGVIGPDVAGADWGEKVELRPVAQTHAPDTLRAHAGLWAINSALEVDLAGQVNAEFIGAQRIASGGGQADFVRGARLAGGAAVIAITARTRDGPSRIVPALSSGHAPTTQPQDVDYVVTEFGVADLRGRSMAQRRAALIAIAHPDDRAELSGTERIPVHA